MKNKLVRMAYDSGNQLITACFSVKPDKLMVYI